jgi:hypothetical protein
MPEYIVRVNTDVVLDREALDEIEDVVYDYIKNEHGGDVTSIVADFN